MFSKNTQAKAKIVQNKKCGTLRLLATFTSAEDKKFITQRNALFVSSDFLIEDLELQVNNAMLQLNTNNIVFLD